MNVKDLLNYNVAFTHHVTKTYLNDITEEEMLVRALPGSNHLAWQLGHLVTSERSLLEAIGADVPDLPEGFAENHSTNNTGSDDTSEFLTKDEYLALMEQMHQAAKAAIDKSDEAGLDAPTPEKVRSICPTVGAVLLMTGSHEMMHSGQIAAIRRKLGKPIVI